MRFIYLLVASIGTVLPIIIDLNPSGIITNWTGHKLLTKRQTSIVAKIADETDKANIVSSLILISARSCCSVVILSVALRHFMRVIYHSAETIL